MRRFCSTFAILILFCVSSSSAEMICPKTEYDKNYKSNLPIIDKQEIIGRSEPLMPHGNIRCKVEYNYKTFKNNLRWRIEEGIYQGIKYRIYFSDGSGSIQGLPTNTLEYLHDEYGTNWSTLCEIDKMNDTHWCFLEKRDLRVIMWKDGTLFVAIGSNHYPGSKMVVRVDKNKPISAPEKSGFTAAQTRSIIGQLIVGSTVVTRYKKWPYQSNNDESFELFGFPQALEILKKIYDSVESKN